MDEKKLRHIGYLTAVCAGASVAIGLVLQFGLRVVLANSVEGVRFEGAHIVGALKGIFMMGVMGAFIGALCGLFSSPEGSKAKDAKKTEPTPPKPGSDDAARETLAKLGIPADKSDSRSN